MSIYKRGQIYWYKFTFNGEAIRESTRQKNQNVARQMGSDPQWTHRPFESKEAAYPRRET
jgi:hypothetical protein